MTEPEPAPPDRSRGSSRLAREGSSYLRAAAEQPIDWYPWGPEPFELARRTGRPILLDIGASWCHWCHVMDEGTYSDPEVARLLSTHFVAVKVDRDQHPEVDRRYQRQVGALTGEGGWPLTGFLTHDGEVFLGGTYFPPTDGHGRPGFRRVLKEVARLWQEEPERIRENAEGIRGALERMRARRAPREVALVEFIGAVRADLLSSYDPVHGGFGGAPKFPHPTGVSLLLWDAFANGVAASADRARDTLVRMAEGGVYDQIGGGFHRYSVDEGWHIPHFEKMAVDNAALLGAYVEGAQRFAEPRLEQTVGGILGWVRGVLADPAGGFGASQDADNAPGDDGDYFTWSRAELKEALAGDELRFATRLFGIGTDGRMPHDPERNVLFRAIPTAEAASGLTLSGPAEAVLARVIERLAARRALRPTPSVDRALYADLNGRFIGALARAGSLASDPTVLADARRAADRFLREAVRPGEGAAHRLDPSGPSGWGLLEDQVAVAGGLVELAGATVDPRYVAPAIALLELVDREFRGEDGLLRDIAPRLYDGAEMPSLAVPSYPLEDSPHLAANAAAALAGYRLSSLVHDERWRATADALLPPIATRIAGAGLFAAGSALAAGLSMTEPATVVIEGEGAAADRLVTAARRAWHPNVWVFRGTPPEPFSLPEALRVAERPKEARALVCFGSACAPPITEPSEIAPRLARGRASG
ncbi:MAG TPA: thioredoxin domain-containing protein [Thermoplasmata archaeon]|nr:thioredoxin domain-containing protein [Thermoplasmata archaeon]